MKKTSFICLWVLGLIVLLFSIIGIYQFYGDYNAYWTAKNANPDLPILTPFGGFYDKSWIAINKASMTCIAGIAMMQVADSNTKFKNNKMVINKVGYVCLYSIFLLIAIYFTFLDPNYSFPDKMGDRSIENFMKDHKK